jgi:hypothetical protein
MESEPRTEVKYTLRQNMYQVATGVFNTIIKTCIIICAGYHSRNICPYNPNNELNLRLDDNKYKNGNKYINDISIGDHAIIIASGEKSVLLVRITSEAYRKEIPEITIYKKWGHKNKYGREEIELCLTGKNTRNGVTHTEIMVAYVRNVEIVATLNYEEYHDIIDKYTCVRSSITRNRSNLRFINV